MQCWTTGRNPTSMLSTLAARNTRMAMWPGGEIDSTHYIGLKVQKANNRLKLYETAAAFPESFSDASCITLNLHNQKFTFKKFIFKIHAGRMFFSNSLKSGFVGKKYRMKWHPRLIPPGLSSSHRSDVRHREPPNSSCSWPPVIFRLCCEFF